MKKTYLPKLLFLLLLSLTWGCSAAPTPTTQAPTQPPAPTTPPTPTAAAPSPPTGLPAEAVVSADIISVQVSGEPGAYQFSVEITSPDTGCDQYADWWEVISESGDLLYRRILTHSHVAEQPFTRSGGPVAIDPGATVWVRAHMFPTGYGGAVFTGSVQQGFAPAEPPPDFAAGLEEQAPLPSGCAF